MAVALTSDFEGMRAACRWSVEVQLGRYATLAERKDAAHRIRSELSIVLENAPAESGAVLEIAQRALLAAAFDAAINEVFAALG
ncbi:hypothetical protein [Roseomonas chloroacetimidivorans]|uniref:hypothetical protein n=1 Tax=Roseomonas chloroacetimidivorans TaxID=1766656 RepID=UPI003C7675CA